MHRLAFPLGFALCALACGEAKNPGDRGSNPTGVVGPAVGVGGSAGVGSGSAGGGASAGAGGAGGAATGEAVIELAVGTTHTCALLERGNVRCWGTGWEGELGYG